MQIQTRMKFSRLLLNNTSREHVRELIVSKMLKYAEAYANMLLDYRVADSDNSTVTFESKLFITNWITGMLLLDLVEAVRSHDFCGAITIADMVAGRIELHKQEAQKIEEKLKGGKDE